MRILFLIGLTALTLHADMKVEESNLDFSTTTTADANPEKRTAPAAKEMRRKSIETDLVRVKEKLAAIGDPKAFQEKMQPLLDSNNAAARQKSARWVENSYFAAGPLTPGQKFGNFPEEIIELSGYLRQRGIDLIVVRIPSRHEVAFPHFAGGPVSPGIWDAQLLALEKQLLEADVEYLDALEPMHRNSHRYALNYWYMLPSENHPAEGLSQIVPELLAQRLARYQLPRTGEYHTAPQTNLFRRTQYPAGNVNFPPETPISAPGVLDAQGKPLIIRETTSSPVLFISDSFGAYPGVQSGASIPHYTAKHTGHLPDWMYRDGSSGGAPAFLYRKGPDFLKGRQVVILLCHPGNLHGDYGTLPSSNLRGVDDSRWQVRQTFGPDNWVQLPSVPAVGEGGKSFAVQPDGTLQLHPLRQTGINGDAGELRFRLPAGGRAFAVRLTFSRHYYLTVTANAGKKVYIDYLSRSEPVKKLLLPVERAPGCDMLKVAFPNVSVGPDRPTWLSQIELLQLPE